MKAALQLDMELVIAVLPRSIKWKTETEQSLKWNKTNTDLCLPTSLLRRSVLWINLNEQILIWKKSIEDCKLTKKGFVMKYLS